MTSANRTIFDRTDPEFSVPEWLNSEISFFKNEIKNVEASRNQETPEVNENLFWIITGLVTAAICGVVIAIAQTMPSVANIGDFYFNPRWLTSLPVITYILAGFKMIDTSEVAGLDFAGKPVMQFGNGLKWYPWPIFRLTIETAHLVQGEMPGDADHIFWGDEEEDLPAKMVRPIFVLSGENPNGQLPTDRQTNLGLSMLIKFQLVKERFFDLVRNVALVDEENGKMIRETITGNQSVTPRLLEVLRHLRDTSAAFASALVGKLSYNELTIYRTQIDELFMLRIKLEILTWGLELKEARFTNINPGHKFNKDLQLRSTAAAERDAEILKAEGKRKAKMLEGEGDARAIKAKLKAEATGQKAILDALKVDGESVLNAEVGKEMARGGNLVFAPSVSGLGAMFAAGFKKQNEKGGSDDSE